MTTGADEFSSSTKDLLAKRSGYICAYPGCRRMTVAVSDDRTSGLTMTGVAAHIAAARSGGPRFDSIMGSDERASERNGIWTCQIHGKAIDDNPSTCTVEELRRWKSQHEQWVFDRVMGGTEKLQHGIARLKLRDVGMFNGERELPLGRHNVLLGLNESGKTTICEILAAFAGGLHWQHFAGRFAFNTEPRKGAFIEALHVASDGRTVVRLSPQHMLADGGRKNRQWWRTHVELNGSPAVDWPRSLFRVLAFGDQLFEGHHTDLKVRFSMALRHLASALSTDEDLVWGSLRDELFANSLFGYRFRANQPSKGEHSGSRRA